MLLLKNLQFLPDHCETLTKEGTHENLILTKFRNDPVGIVDFLVKVYFWPSPETPGTQCKSFCYRLLTNHGNQGINFDHKECMYHCVNIKDNFLLQCQWIS